MLAPHGDTDAGGGKLAHEARLGRILALPGRILGLPESRASGGATLLASRSPSRLGRILALPGRGLALPGETVDSVLDEVAADGVFWQGRKRIGPVDVAALPRGKMADGAIVHGPRRRQDGPGQPVGLLARLATVLVATDLGCYGTRLMKSGSERKKRSTTDFTDNTDRRR
jgi:hypothetical protein